MKCIFPIYAFPIRDLENELWIFEVHPEVHEVHSKQSPVTSHQSRVTSHEAKAERYWTVKERSIAIALRRGDIKRIEAGWEDACGLKQTT
jgi:hypothetical protein